jgi:uncharacterized protein (DUF1778 family)
MSAPRAARTPAAAKSENLMIRVDRSSKGVIAKAARLRGISASDYVRSVVVTEARREVKEAAKDQLAFFQALKADVKLTVRQRALGKLMRGER